MFYIDWGVRVKECCVGKGMWRDWSRMWEGCVFVEKSWNVRLFWRIEFLDVERGGEV